jgi:hypothetical protein
VTDELERAVGADRRTFVKRLVIGTAFAVPAVSSLTMSGVEAVFGADAGPITALANSNCTPAPAPPNYPVVVNTFQTQAGLDVTFPDGVVTLHLVIPKNALAFGTCVTIYAADLAALRSLVPSDQIPVSGYAVVWQTPVADAKSPITFTVNDMAVADGDPISKFDKVTGELVADGTATDHQWVVSFTEDPAFVVTGVAECPPPPPPDDGGSSRGTRDDHGRGDRRADGSGAAATAQPATAVASEPRFTG